MPGVSDFCELFWERFNTVRWSEEGGLDVVLFVEFQEAVDTNSRAIDATRDVGWVLRRPITGVDPVCHSVDIDYRDILVDSQTQRSR